MASTIRISQETYDKLMEIKLANGLSTMDEAVRLAIDEADKEVIESDTASGTLPNGRK